LETGFFEGVALADCVGGRGMGLAEHIAEIDEMGL